METSKKKQKPSKEQVEERAQAKARKQLLRKLKEQDTLEDNEDEMPN